MSENVQSNTQDVTFQVSDWDYCHDNIEHGEDVLRKYIIRMYGTTKDNKKIFVKVKEYTPYFFVEIPKSMKKHQAQTLINTVKDEVKRSKNPELENSLKSWDLVDKHIFWEFTNYKLFQFIRLIFHSYEGFRAFEKVFNRAIKCIILHPKPKKYKLYESNIEPLLRCMHIRKINSVGWIKIKGGKYNHFSEETNPSYNEIGIYTDWTNLEPIEDNTIAPLIIAAFDLECTSGDGSFPQPKRDADQIIQISTTLSRYGEDECFFKHVITLDTCDKIEGVTVESYKTESEVLLAWTKLIRRTNPDIITGYNIFGFDYRYLKKRAVKLGCDENFSKLGRIKNEKAPFIKKTLMSAALGTNKLYYYTMQGRVNIDIMKVVQRDFKLGSYKLDNVASDFIKEKIKKVEFKGNRSIIVTRSIYGLEVGRYIKISFNDGLSDNSYKNEAKFKVLQINHKYMSEVVEDKGKSITIWYDSIEFDGILDGEALELKKYKVSWCQAKDDVSPNDIFRMQKETSKERAIVASYCIAEGTPIMLNNQSIMVEKMDECDNNVLSWDDKEKGLMYSKQSKFFNNGLKECVELTFEDGTKLTCTEDHKMLTSTNEWVEAKDLKINIDRCVKGFTVPVSDIEEDIKLYTTWSFGKYNLSNKTEYNKTMAYMRILGYALTDGMIATNRATLYVGTRIDVDSIISDIRLICDNPNLKINVRKTENTFTFDLPRSISKEYLTIPGILPGKRINQEAKWPEFILDNNCPLPVLREFLGGVFGGDGHTCHVIKKNGGQFRSVGFSQTKSENYIESLKTFISQLGLLLNKFGIKTTVQNIVNKDTRDINKHFSILLNVEREYLPLFEETIGFRHCVHKSIRLAIASSYDKIRKNIHRQADWIIQKTKELKEEYKYKEALEESCKLLKEHEPIYNSYYSLPNYNTVVRRISDNRLSTEAAMKHKYFPSVEDYLKNVGALEYFIDENVPKTTKIYAVKKESKVVPTYNLKIINRKNVGVKQVYDMEIEGTHSYVAGGFVVHNCTQDSSICNKLMNKLQILTNNIGMANVCHVPLSYIFLRGQGIKVFSLVSKKCRERNHVIPVIKKLYKPTEEDKKNHPTWYKNMEVEDEEEEDNGYEGATVFEPTSGVHFEPITVLDYNSLYPNSMIFRNISHECNVKDPQYDNLPGYNYEEVTYSNKNGSTTTCRYAKSKAGLPGILPEILTELLNARARMRKLAEVEPDPFKAKILDSLQLAYKITANSLYGQTGASTSPICMKDVAASTTATGREMLNCARILTEIIFPILVNAILFESYESFEQKINLLFDKKIDELIGKKNVRILKEMREGEEIERYSYLRIFTNNREDINKKFIDAKLKHACKNDFVKWFHDEVYKVLSGKYIDPHVIYGDSVTKDTPILLRHNHEIKILKIEDIGTYWKEYDQFKKNDLTLSNKQQDDNIELEVWTDMGWSKIKRVIRHNTKKEIYRICTRTGVVDVTEDHSLLTDKVELLKPEKCVIGETKLLHKFPEIINNEIDSISENKAFVYGFFMGNGFCGKYETNETNETNETKSDVKYQWYLCNSDMKVLIDLQNKCKSEYVDYDFKILDTLKSSNMYRLVYIKGIKPFYEEYHNKFYDNNKHKIIPQEILNGSSKIKKAFLNGYYVADGCSKDTGKIGCYRFDIKGKISALNMYYLVKSLGYNTSINTRKDKMEIYRINYTKQKQIQRKDPTIVKKIYKLGITNDYVYDLETEVGHFHAGVGELIVKNTDSIFIKYGICNNGETVTLKDEISLSISIKLGQLTSALLYKILPSPQNAGYEKTMHPLILLSKKRYVGNKYEFDINEFYQLCMGIVLKRRDNAPIVKIIIGGIVNSILNDKSPEKAVAFAKQTLRNILTGKYPLEKFIITKTLKGNGMTEADRKIEARKPKEQRSYVDRTRIVHAVLADRMAERDPGNKPSSNDRIPYAYVITDGDVELQGDRVENPEYIIDNKLQLDYLFYITNQIMKPAIQFLEHVIDNPEKIFETCIMKEINRRTGKRPLSYYFNLLEELQKQDDAFGDVEDNEDMEYEDKNNVNGFSCYNDNVATIQKPINKVVVKNKPVKKVVKKVVKKAVKKKVKHVNETLKKYDTSSNGFVLDL